MVEWPSGQRQQTVNLSASAYVGSNPTSTTTLKSVGSPNFFRASSFYKLSKISFLTPLLTPYGFLSSGLEQKPTQ